MLPHLPSLPHFDRATRQQVGAVAVAALAVAGVALLATLRKRPTPAEIESARRSLLASEGRIIDGTIVGIDGSTEDMPDTDAGHLAAPQVLVYRYRIAGVTYECAQDVSMLAARVHRLRLDLPVQVRYEPRNPGNSILVAEQWSGLQVDPSAD